MSITARRSATPQISALVLTLSGPERLEFECCLESINQWMARGAPRGPWRDLRPAMGIVIGYLMRIPTLTLAQMEALIVLNDEISRRTPDLRLMHFVWTT